jgi:glycosyltransferase involved in cell wall biosynthesis
MGIPRDHLQVALVGTYPPRMCGIATFTRDLRDGLGGGSVIAIDRPQDGLGYPPEVVFKVGVAERDEYVKAAEVLNAQADVVSLQHEYGIFGGPDGELILELLTRLQVPLVTTLHTVRAQPTQRQRQLLRSIALASCRVVVMSRQAREIAHRTFEVPAERIVVIPHGVPDLAFGLGASAKRRLGLADRTLILTFGLLGPNKRIELVLEALNRVLPRFPNAVYAVVGVTHPELRRQGEAYRERLLMLVRELGLDQHVQFVDRYLSSDELATWLQATDIFVTPYGNAEQIASGTLAYALAAGKAIISTPYEHALDLLGAGRGLLVPFNDVEALAKRLAEVLADDRLRMDLGRRAYALGHRMTWQAVAAQYQELFRQLVGIQTAAGRAAAAGRLFADTRELAPRVGGIQAPLPPPVREHLNRLSDGRGIFQHAEGPRPDARHGYCTDDVARALRVDGLQAERLGAPAVRDDVWARLAFLAEAFNHRRGRFRNFREAGGAWLEEVGSEDSHGRALQALGETARRIQDESIRSVALRLLERAAPGAANLTYLRPWAYSILGCDAGCELTPDRRIRRMVRLLGSRLAHAFASARSRNGSSWPWPEEVVTYDNGVLPQALIVAGIRMQRTEWVDLGLDALDWLIRAVLAADGHLSPIGNRGWWHRRCAPARFDQQPIEAASLVEAAATAFDATRDRHWVSVAEAAFAWFLGANDLGIKIADPGAGRCADGLTPLGLNTNFGAESTLVWLAVVERMRTIRESGLVALSAPLRTRALAQVVQHLPQIGGRQADRGVGGTVVEAELP